MGNTSITPTAAAMAPKQSQLRTSQIYIEKLSPRAFSATADTMEGSMDSLVRMIQGMTKQDDVEWIESKCEAKPYLLGVNGAFFVVTIEKLSAGTRYQASVCVRI